MTELILGSAYYLKYQSVGDIANKTVQIELSTIYDDIIQVKEIGIHNWIFGNLLISTWFKEHTTMMRYLCKQWTIKMAKS